MLPLIQRKRPVRGQMAVPLRPEKKRLRAARRGGTVGGWGGRGVLGGGAPLPPRHSAATPDSLSRGSEVRAAEARAALECRAASRRAARSNSENAARSNHSSATG